LNLTEVDVLTRGQASERIRYETVTSLERDLWLESRLVSSLVHLQWNVWAVESTSVET